MRLDMPISMANFLATRFKVMVNSSSVNVGYRKTTRGEDIPAEGTVSLPAERFSPRPGILLGRRCGSACLVPEMGQGSEMGPTVCPMVCRRIVERIRECCRQTCEILAQEESGISLGG